ncbi:Unknown protein [Striga hermonthica]|uniref:SWIM-type domain-containing protein n=1 Tax=Striga hermonthica TaxID=68872 RepID=A0A9N7NMD1_STRHE|nr:Unknown protein [Striga hermonthica]
MVENLQDLSQGLDGEPELSLALVELPAQHMQRSLIDWDTLRIEENRDDEGRIEIVDDEVMYEMLGFRAQDEEAEKAREDAEKASEAENNATPRSNEEIDTTEAAIEVDDYLPGERIVVHDPNRPRMDLGTVYPNMKEFRLAMIQFAINKKFELHIAKTDPSRYIGGCKAMGCPWHIVGRRQPDGCTVMVTVLVDEHKCASSDKRKTTTPTTAWVASKAIHHLRRKIIMGTKELQEVLEQEHECKIVYDTVQRGRHVALRQLHGDWEGSFQLLFNWKAEVLKRCPGSVIEIDIVEVEGLFYFHRFFCALKPCIEGFLEGCRPYLSIDSTELNGRWNGHLAAACGLDGHNWMYPVAFGFIDGETTDNWTWFMTQLHKAIGDLPVLAISSDACKGLENAVKNVFPHAEHRECFRHLMNNFIKRFGGDVFSKMYPAARTYRESVFQYFYKLIIDACPEVLVWMEAHHYKLWMRSAFNPEIKCDYITNNLAEVFNNWIKDWKDLPVVELADKLREKIMVLWAKRRKISQALSGKILPTVVQQLNARTRGLGHLTVVDGGSDSAEIWDTSNTHTRHVVKAHLHECTCLEWQHTGKPCQHALALIISAQIVNVPMENFVHEYYSVKRFQAAYKRLIEPLPDKSQWPDVELPFGVKAPLDKKAAGRYRKLRIKGFLEGGNSKGKKAAKEKANEANKQAADETEKGKKQMIRGKRKCNGCGELGHSETSYKCHLNGTKKRPRKPRKNTTKYGANAKIPTKRAKKGETSQEMAATATEPPTPNFLNEQAMDATTPNFFIQQAMPAQALNALSSPTRLTREQIIENSPTRLTRGQLQTLLGEVSPDNMVHKKSPTKKLKPRKMKTK